MRKLSCLLLSGIVSLIILVGCGTPTPPPPPTPGPTSTPTPAPSSHLPSPSTWVKDQFGAAWANIPVSGQRSTARTNLVLQAGASWKWDRWSAFWFWVEQPDRWGAGNLHFPDGDETFANTTFNLHAPASGNEGHLNTLIVLDGIVRRYDCVKADSLCFGSNNTRNERIQGLFLDSTDSDNHWANYVYQTVNYFKQFGIHYYQAYNEPNIGQFNGADKSYSQAEDPNNEGWADAAS